MDATDRHLINRLQDGFPVVERPYAAVATELGLAEADVIARVGRLLANGTLSRFGPLFDAERMGAVARNYTNVTGMAREGDGRWRLDLLRGLGQPGQERLIDRRCAGRRVWFLWRCVLAELGDTVCGELNEAVLDELHDVILVACPGLGPERDGQDHQVHHQRDPEGPGPGVLTRRWAWHAASSS